MAEDINTGSASETEVAGTAPTVKKQRAPRAKKLGAAASVANSEPVKKNRGGRPKRAEAIATAPAARAKRAATDTSTTGKRGGRRVTKPSTVASPLADDLADLLQLEEENQRLRKSLAEKLRAENADLRSRLGLK